MTLEKDNKSLPHEQNNSAKTDNSPTQKQETSTDKKSQSTTEKKVEKSEQQIRKNNTDSSKSMKNKAKETPRQDNANKSETGKQQNKESNTTKALSVIAIIIALGVGAGGYFWGSSQVAPLQKQINALEQKLSAVNQISPQVQTALDTLSSDTNQIKGLSNKLSDLQSTIQQVGSSQSLQSAQYNELRNELNRLSFNNKSTPQDWIYSEADYLINNAALKLSLDNDIPTTLALLKQANSVLSKVNSSTAISIRTAIRNDIDQLLSVNQVDQNQIMGQLSQLIAQVDNLKILDVYRNENNPNGDKLGGISQWQENIKRSAESFLNKFIKISPRNQESNVALLAPNQDIYLRENILLSLQMALLSVPREQNDIYHQSLESVAIWVRTYFDTDTSDVKQFLTQLEQLEKFSINIDKPTQLSSLTTIDNLLLRQHSSSSDLSKGMQKLPADVSTNSTQQQ